MPQVTKQSYDEVRIPLTAMSFTPDVPATQLGANEYNAGLNVEADVRGIRSVAGEQEILSHIPGTPNYITGGFRQDGYFWFVAATDEGKWWANRGDHIGNPTGNGGVWIDITPGGTTFTGYAQNTNITEAWNGTVVIFNDTINPPFFLPDEANTKLVNYKNNQTAVDITTIGALSAGQRTITVSTAYATAPFVAGDRIAITMTSGNTAFTGVYKVVSSTTTTITYETTVADACTAPARRRR